MKKIIVIIASILMVGCYPVHISGTYKITAVSHWYGDAVQITAVDSLNVEVQFVVPYYNGVVVDSTLIVE